MGAAICLVLSVAPSLVSGQTATGALDLSTAPRQTRRAFQHDKELVSTYDSLTDSTHLAVVTHSGTYLLWIQRPRLTWTVAYAGRAPSPQLPPEIRLVFRTTDPQSPKDNHLVIEAASGERLELNSVSAESRAGPMRWSLLMDFLIPTAELARVLADNSMRLSVGGIAVKFKRDHMEALRDLLNQAAVPESEAPDTDPGGGL